LQWFETFLSLDRSRRAREQQLLPPSLEQHSFGSPPPDSRHTQTRASRVQSSASSAVGPRGARVPAANPGSAEPDHPPWFTEHLLRESEFIEAAILQGLPLRNMVFRQLLPNVGPYVAINFLLDVTGAIYAEVGLFVLGIAPVSGTNWGTMINFAIGDGALYTTKSLLYLVSPMAAIVILQVALVFFSRSLDRVFNPRLRVQ